MTNKQQQCKFCNSRMSAYYSYDDPKTREVFTIYVCDLGCNAMLRKTNNEKHITVWITKDNHLEVNHGVVMTGVVEKNNDYRKSYY